MTPSEIRRRYRALPRLRRALLLAAAGLLVALATMLPASAALADPCGPTGNEITCENAQPGSPASEWEITGQGDPTIQGFADGFSFDQGQTVGFKITTTASSYGIDIYRLGYYGGLGARKVATIPSSAVVARNQPACATDVTGLADCGTWSVSASWAIPASAASGVYVARPKRTDTGGASHIVFVVRDDDGNSSLLAQISDATWQAYNRGLSGNSLYFGTHTAVGVPAGRAYKVSYNRPFTTRAYESKNWLFALEYPMIRFLERNGYDVSYFTGLDASARGAEIPKHRTYMVLGHDEYWSQNQRTSMQSARDAGTNLAFFTGNDGFWKTRWEPSIDGAGTPFRTMVSYKETANTGRLDPSGIWTGLWRSSPASVGDRPENEVTGTLFEAQTTNDMFVPAADGKLRLWRNTSVATLAPGTEAAFPGTLGYEWNEAVDNLYRPPGLVYMSTSTHDLAQRYDSDGPGTSTHHLTLYKHRSGARVFSAGLINWPWNLDQNHDEDPGPTLPDARIQQATVNLLADLGAQPADLQGGLVQATASTDTVAPTATVSSPPPVTSFTAGDPVTITGTAADAGGIVGGVEVSLDGGHTFHPATGRTSWTYSTLAPSTGSLDLKVRAIDDSGNIGSPAAASCRCTIWRSTATPATASVGDTSPYTLGVKFRVDAPGFISGLRFYKGAGNTGTHVGHLWTAGGVKLAEATFAGESASGWQEVEFPAPVSVTPGTTYVASYYAPNGGFSVTQPYFSPNGVESPPLHALADGVSGANGVYLLGGNGFPVQTFGSSNYWVDVVYETTASDHTPPTITSTSPAANATNVPRTADITTHFNEQLAASTVGAATFELRDAANAVVAATVTYDSASGVVKLDPTARLAAQTTYTMTVRGGPGGVTDTAGNPLAANRVWSFTTPAQNTCPCSFFPVTATPTELDVPVNDPYELGVRFTPDVSGYVNAIRFYKGPANTGVHKGHLWNAAGAQLGEVTFTGESAQGWQTAQFASPIPVTANQTYTASYFVPNGHFSRTTDYFSPLGVDAPPLFAFSSPEIGGNGVFANGGSVFPTQSFAASNYYVDVVFGTAAADTSPPTVVSTTPGSGATGISVGTNITATFSEALAPLSVNATTFELRDPSGTLVPASVQYIGGSVFVTTDPTSPLQLATTYTARLRGGPGGIADPAGNALAADYVWSFTTSQPVACPCSIWTTPPTPANPSVELRGIYELGIKFRSDIAGYVTGVRFYKGAANTGTHRGRVWTAAGTMLADAVFTNESATGWQAVRFDTPVAIDVNTTYVASYYAPNGGFAQDHPYFGTGVDNPPLHALADGVDGPNGTYKFEPYPDEYPFLGFDASNYYVDVVFEQTATDTTPPVTRLLTKPPAATTSGDADFTFKPEPQAVAACSLDGSPYTTCTSPLSYRALAEGQHTFRVRATDTFGNVETVPVLYSWVVDGTPPAAPALTFGGFANASATGSTVFFRPGASGGFTVTGTSSDGAIGSGIANLAFPSLGGTWTGGGTDTTSPYEGTYAFGTGSTQPAGVTNVTATDNAGTSSAPTPFTVLADASAPVTTAACDGGACTSGWHVGPVSVTLAATDGGSGVDVVRYTTDGSAPTAASPAYTSAIAVGATTTIRYAATDRVGNVEAPNTLVLQVDSTAPSAPTLSYSAFSNASARGDTVFYRPGVAGGFTVTGLSSDAESGIVSYDYPVLASGWSHVAGAYSFTAAAADPADPSNVTATNGSSLVSPPTGFTVTPDGLAPVTSASCNGAACSGGWYTTSPVMVDLSAADAAGSGVAVVRYTADGSVPTAASAAFAGPLAITATTTIRFAATDAVGNVEAAQTLQVRVDTTAPTTPAVTPTAGANAFVSGTVVYFRGGAAGAFTLGASSQDPESGIAAYLFPPLGTGWSVDAAGLYSFTAAAVDPVEPLAVAASNNAGLQTTAGFTVTLDATAPVSTAGCNGALCSAGWYTAAPVSVALAASDTGGSGVDVIRYTTDGTDPTPASPVYAAPLGVSVTTTVKFRAYDHVGNAEATHEQVVQVDSTAPSAPSLSYSAFTNASRTASTVYFRPGVAGGFTLTPLSADPDSGVASYGYPTLGSGWSRTGGVYTFSTAAADPADPSNVTATNGAGLTSAASGFDVTPDGTAPTTTVACTGGCPGWHTATPVTVTLSAADGGSGVATVRYTTDGSDPTTGALYTAPLAIASTRTVRYAAADNVGNVALGQQLVQVDTTAPSAPTLALTAGPAASVTGGTVFFRGNAAGSFTLVPSSTDAESGVASYTYPPLSPGWSLAGGVYSFTATASDPAEPNDVTATNGAGLTSAATSVTVTRDGAGPSVPTTCNGAPCSTGWYTTTPVALALDANDGSGSGVASVRYTTDGSDPAGGTPYSTPIPLLATTTVRYAATDKVGNVTTGQQLVQIDTTAPTTSGFTYSNLSNASVTGDEVFFRPGVAGTFTVDANPIDAQSGITTTAYPALGSGWAGAGAYTFTTAAVDPVEPLAVVATNGAGLDRLLVDGGGGSSSTSSFTVTPDGAAPVTTATCSGGCAGWHTAGPVTVTLTAADALSGVQLIRYTTNGTDPTAASPIYTGALAVAATTTLKFRAYDRVGNEEAIRTQIVLLDTTPPSAPALAFSALSSAAVTGNTVYYRSAGTGGFTLTASSLDAESGVTGYTLPSFGSGWTRSGGAYTFGSGAADPIEPNNVTATNAAGLVSGPTSFTVTPDDTAPVTTAACNGAACGAAFHTTSPVSVTLVSSDGGSGVGVVRYTTDGSDPTGSSAAYGGAISVAQTTTVKFRAYDRVGNAETTVTQLVRVDTTPPSTPAFAFSGLTNAALASGTLWYRPSAAGGFTVTPSSSDPESGVSSFTYPTLGSGWTNASGTYSFAAGATDPAEPNTVTATNGAGLAAGASISVDADSTAPATTASCGGGACASSWYTTAPVSVALAATDAQSGVAAIRYTTDGSAPTAASTLYAAPVAVGATTTLRYAAFDRVGNAEAPQALTVQVDTTAPSAPALTFDGFSSASLTGTTVYYRPGATGGFTVHAASLDAESGIASVLYPALGSGWAGTGGVYSFLPGASDPAEPLGVTATNGAGLTSAATTFTVTPDASAPVTTVTCAAGACAAGWYTASPVDVALAATDLGSGVAQIRYTTDGSDPSPIHGATYLAPFPVSASTTVRFRAYDRVGNEEAVGEQAIRIDTTPPGAPSLAFSALTNAAVAGGTVYYRADAAGSFTVNATASDAESSVASTSFPGFGGGWTNTNGFYSFAAGAVDPVEPNGVTATNNAGLTSVATNFTVSADGSAPVTAASCNGAACGGWYTTAPVSLALTATDSGSGVDVIRYTTDGSTPTAASAAYTGPISIGATTTVTYRAYDRVGNPEAARTQLVQVDTTPPDAPALSFAGFTNAAAAGSTVYFRPGAAGGFTVAGASADPQSAVASTAFPPLGSGWTNAGGAYSFTAAATDPAEPLQVTATNGAGLAARSGFTVTPDALAPTSTIACDLAACAVGTYAAVPLSVTITAADGLSGVREIRYTTDGSDPATGTLYTGAFLVSTATTVRFLAIDRVGNTETSQSMYIAVDTSAPTAPVLELGGFTNASATGSTVYFRPGAAGGFTVAGTATDGPSGLERLTFPALGAGWAGGGADTTSPYEGTYTFTAAAVDPSEPLEVTARNNAGLTSVPTAFTVTADASAPAVTATCTAGCSGWHSAAPVDVTLAATDTGSGVDVVRYTTNGSDPATGTVYSGPIPVSATATLRWAGYDRVGNVTLGSQLVQVDTTAPSAPALSFGGFTNASATGAVVYYRPGVAGAFTATASASDDQSGIAGYDYPALGSGWANTAGAYTFTAAAGDPVEPNTVRATNAAGLSTGSTFTVTPDSTGPTVAVSCTAGCAGWHTAAPVSVTIATTDAGAGPGAVLYTTDGTNPEAGAAYAGPLAVGATATVRWAAYDAVGNVTLGSQLVQVDTSAPSAPALSFSALANASYSAGTLYFRGGAAGGFTVNATSTDAESGIAGYAYPPLGPGFSHSGGVYTFTTSAGDPADPHTVVATNNAGLTASAGFDVTYDGSAPTTTMTCTGGCAGFHTTTPVTVTLTAADTGSGVDVIRYTTDGSTPTTASPVYTAPLAVATTTAIGYRAWDKVGNAEVAKLTTVSVDTTAPAAPTLFLTPYANTSVTASTVYFRPGATGRFTVAASVVDPESSIASRNFPALGSGWTLAPGSLGDYTYDATAGDPAEPNNVTATNGAGLTSPATSFTVSADSTAPTTSVTCSGGLCSSAWYTSSPVTVTLDSSDGGSGFAQLRYTTDGSDPTLALAGYGSPLSIPVAATSTVRWAAYDKVGNVSTGSQLVRIDASAPTVPTFSFSGFANATAVGPTVYFRPGTNGGFTATASSTDPESGVSGYAYPSLGSGWSGAGGVYTFGAAAGDPVEPNNATATNGAGLTASGSFTVTADSTAPVTTPACDGVPCTTSWYTSSSVSIALTAADAQSGLDRILYTTNGLDPTPLTGITYAGPFTLAATTTIKFRAYDKVGNEELVGSRLIQIDATAPPAPSLAFTGLTNAAVTGNTVYYREGAASAFTVVAASADADSGIAGYGYPLLGTGWSGVGGAFTSAALAFDPVEPLGVTATNGAGLTSAPAPFTVTADSTDPVTTVSCDGAACGSGWYTSGSVAISLASSDVGSGVQEIRYTTDGTDPTASSGNVYSAAFPVSATTTVRYRAFDRVGHAETVRSAFVRVDSSAPGAATVLVTATGVGQYADGTTLYYNPSAGRSGTFGVDVTSNDGESGLARVVFPALAGMTGGGEDTTAPHRADYSWTPASSASGPQTIAVENGAGLAASTTFTVTPDTDAPAGGSVSYAGGYTTTGNVAIAVATGTDVGAGIATTVLERQTAALADGACGAYGAWAEVLSTTDTVASGRCAVYRLRVTDRVGNEAIFGSAAVVKVDASAPQAPGLAIAESQPTEHVVATTLYYNPSAGNSGSFTVSATSGDAESGLDRIAFPLVTGLTGGGDDSSSPYASTYGWSSGASASGPQQVTAVNRAGLTTPSSFTLVPDTAAPTGQAITTTADEYVTTASIAFTTTSGADALSGLDLASAIVERASAQLADGSCGTFSAYGGSYASPDTSVVSGECYRYRYAIGDNVGNRSAWTESSVVKVDTTAPPLPQLHFGSFTAAFEQSGTLWFRSAVASAFTVTVTAADPESGIASTGYPDLGTGWTRTAGAYSAAAGASDPVEPLGVTATNRAGLTSAAAPFTVTADDTPPTGGSIAYGDAYFTAPSVGLTLLDGSDNGSGLDTANQRLESAAATLTEGVCAGFSAFTSLAVHPPVPFSDLTVASGRCYRYRYVVSDRVGNTTTYTSTAAAKVDLDAPTVTQTDPGANVRLTVSLAAAANDLGGSGLEKVAFERSPAGAGTWTLVGEATGAPYATPLDTTALAEGLYDLRAIATDRAGHVTTSAVVTGRRVDNVAPAVTFPGPAAYLRGAVILDSTSSDAGSGVASVVYERRLGAGPWIVTPSSWTTTAADDGVYDFRVTVTDAAGNQTTRSATGRHVDNTPPTATMGALPAKVRGTVALTSTTADTGGSGLASVQYERSVAGGPWLATSASWATLDAEEGPVSVRVVATDLAGNSTASAPVSTVLDNSAPVATSVDPADGSSSVAPAAAVSATFSRAMDPATITAATFTLTGPGGAVPATVAYDGGTRTATLTPAAALDESSTFTASLAATVAAADGEPIFAAKSWTFATGIAPPAITGRTPAPGATGVSVTAPGISVTFSRAMDASTITAANFTLTAPGNVAVSSGVSYDPATRIATLTPSAQLANTTVYTVLVKTGVKSTQGVALAAASSWTFTTVAPSPTVTSRTPSVGATGVAVGVAPAATFSIPMDPATVTGSSFTLTGPGGSAVAAAVLYDAATQTATLTPAAPLANETAYTATLSTAVASAAGVPLAAPVSWSFTTVAPAPSVTARTPAPAAIDVATGTAVTATFSRAMNAATIDGASFTLSGPGGTVAATVAYDGATRKATLTPAAALANATTYTATLTTAILSTDSIPLQSAVTWSFTTVANPPVVLSRTPAPGASGVARTTTVVATFSKPMNAATLSAITLSGPGGVVASTVALDGPGTTATLTPSATLASSTTYTATLGASLAAADGTTLGTANTWTFTTVAPPAAISWTPATGATGQDLMVRPTATFSEDMLASSITNSTFTLTGPAGAVLANVAYSPATKTATLAPLSPLDYSKSYTAQLSTAVKALDGAPLAAPVTWTFTSSSAGYAKRYESGGTAAYVMGGNTFDLDGSGKGGLTRTSTNPIAGTTDDLLYQTERYGLWSYATNVPNGTYIVRTHHAETLKTAAAQRVFNIDILETTGVDATNVDLFALAGANTAYTRSFTVTTTTGRIQVRATAVTGDPQLSALEIVPAYPTVTANTPATGATNVARTTTVTATFSRAMDAATINASTVRLLTPAGAVVPATVAYNPTTRVVTLTPAAQLLAATTYTAEVNTGAQASEGMALAAPFTWTFRTI